MTFQKGQRGKAEVHRATARYCRRAGIPGSLHRLRSVGRDRDPQHGRHSRRRASRGARRRVVHGVGADRRARCCTGSRIALTSRRCTIPTTSKAFWRRAISLARTFPRWRCSIRRFTNRIPEQAYLYAIPYHLYRRHRIRRYGFHGTSHRYVAFRYRALRGLTREQTNIITLHLGNGCSAAAIRQGSSVDTSMGMTPLEGLVMGTRSGDLDPAIVNLIATKEGMSLVRGRDAAQYAVWIVGNFRADQ